MPFAERNLPRGVPSLDDHPKRRPIVDYAISKVAVGMPASEVAEAVVQAIRERRFYVLPHLDDARAALEDRLRWMLDDQPPPGRPDRPSV